MQSNKINIRAFDNQERYRDSVSIDTVKSYQIDFGAWAEDNGEDIVSVLWESSAGQVTITNQTLVNNVATAIINFGQVGVQLIKVTATTQHLTYVAWLEIYCKDLSQTSWYASFWGY